MAGILRTGVAASLFLLLLGTTVTFVRHPDYLSDPSTLAQLTQHGASFPRSISQMVSELAHGRGRAITTLGLLLLILTPVLRVAASAFTFLRQGDRIFAVLTSLVLVILLLSFLLGRVE